MSRAEVEAYLHSVLVVLGHQRIEAKLSKDFRNVTVSTKLKGVPELTPGVFELYPKAWFEGEEKPGGPPGRTLNDKLAEVEADALAGFTARLEADGFTDIIGEVHF
jgi:hypothetical protein